MDDRISPQLPESPSKIVHIGRSFGELSQRHHVLQLVAAFPAVVEAIRKVADGATFQVVIDAEHAHLFKQRADGLFSTVLHNGKQIVGRVDLERVPTDYASVLSNIALMASMAAISAKLATIEVGVRNITRLMENKPRWRVKGALDALALARALNDPAERRHHMLSEPDRKRS
jgi:hypothetical protein